VTAIDTLTAFREGLAGIEALIVLDGIPVTLVTGLPPFDLAPARSWATHGAFLTWAEREHGTVERAVGVLIEGRRRVDRRR